MWDIWNISNGIALKWGLSLAAQYSHVNIYIFQLLCKTGKNISSYCTQICSRQIASENRAESKGELEKTFAFVDRAFYIRHRFRWKSYVFSVCSKFKLWKHENLFSPWNFGFVFNELERFLCYESAQEALPVVQHFDILGAL